MKRWILLLLLCFSLTVRAGETVQLTQQFKNADIRDVIEAVAKLTGRNFVLDPRVQGKVTLIAPEPMPADSLYETLLAMLRVNGFGAVPGRTAIKIVPLSTLRDKVPAGRVRWQDDWETRVITVHWVKAAQMVPVLRPIVAREGFIAALPQGQQIVVVDSAANVARIARVAHALDRPESAYDVITLKHADGESLRQTLQPLTPKDVRVAYDPQGNRMILSGPEQPRRQLMALIAQLDQPGSENGQVKIIYLHYAKAKDLAQLLRDLAKSHALQAVADGKATKKGAAQLRPNAKGTSPVSIEADERMNALLISGPAALVRALHQVVKQLDIRRAQVLIEAVVAEISADKAAQLGIEWGASGPNGIGVINFTGAIPALIGNIGNPVGQAQAIGRGVNAVVGEQYGNDQGWGALIRLLKTDSQANIVSTPTLLTLDNEEAEIIVGREVPFQTGRYTSTGNSSTPTNPFTTIERRNVGLKLRIKPLINEGDEVQLKLALEVSDILPKGDAVDLQTSKREIKTSVIVGNGNVVVLGGLLTQKEREANGKVPGLGDIPGLGALFRNHDNRREKVNLMMFIRPVIVRDAAFVRAYSRRKYHLLRQQQAQVRPQMGDRVIKGLHPALPPLEKSGSGGNSHSEVRVKPEPAATSSQDGVLQTLGF